MVGGVALRSHALQRAVITFPLLLLAGSGYTAIHVAGLQAWRADQAVAAVPLQMPPATTGLSQRDHNDLLGRCHTHMTSLSGLLMTRPERDQMVESCGAIVEKVVTSSPLNAYAWFVKALVDEEGLHFDLVVEDVQRSQQLAPNSASLAFYRVEKLFEYYDLLNPNAMDVLVDDIGVAARSDRGMTWLARLYMQRPEYHNLLVAAIEAEAGDAPRRFISAMNALVR